MKNSDNDDVTFDILFYFITVTLFLIFGGIFIALLCSESHFLALGIFGALGALDGILIVSYISCNGGRTPPGPYTLKDYANDMKINAPNLYADHPNNYGSPPPTMHVDVHQAPQPDHWLTHFTGELIRDTTGFDLFTGEYHG